jgi:putative addiction module component (TIGR02574 family)
LLITLWLCLAQRVGCVESLLPLRLFAMSKFSAADTLEMSVAERLQLMEEIWNTIVAAPEALPLGEEDKRLIDERLEARRRDPQAGSSWEEVYARIVSRRK